MFREREGIRRGEEKDTGGGLQWSDLLPGAGTQFVGERKVCGEREREREEGMKKQTLEEVSIVFVCLSACWWCFCLFVVGLGVVVLFVVVGLGVFFWGGGLVRRS